MNWYRRAMVLMMCFCLLLANWTLAEEPVNAETTVNPEPTEEAVNVETTVDPEPTEEAANDEESDEQNKAAKKAPKKVTITEGSEAKVSLGSVLQLHAEVTPEGADGNPLKWTSSSKKIATVDENGLVTPVKEGTVTITVKTANGKSDSVKVKVVDPYKPEKVILSESGTVTLAMDKTLTLNAAFEPATAKSELKWTSSSTKIAKVKDGVVTPVKEGTVTITVKTANGKSDSVKVKVIDPYKPEKVILSESGTVTLDIDKTLTLNAAFEPSTAKSELKWTSSSTKIAKVKDGMVTPVKEGTVTITVKTANGKSDTVKVKVVDPYKPEKVILSESGTVTLAMDDTLTLKAAFEPATAKSELKWTSSSTKIAKVKDGVVTPVKEGTVTITVKTANGKSDSVKVKVVDPYKPEKVILSESGTVTLAMDKTLTLKAAFEPATAKSALKWTSSSTKIAKVKDGVVTPVKEGTVTITVKTANGKSDSVKVKVVDPYKPEKVILSESGTVTLAMDKTLTLKAAFEPATAKSALKWTSSSTKIAKVKDGVVTPVKEGTVTITVKTANGKSDNVKVKVVDPYKPTKVELSASGTVTLETGKTLELQTKLQPATAKTTFKWTSSSTKVAAVKDGIVTALKPGTVTIPVTTANGLKDTVKVKVVAGAEAPDTNHVELKPAITSARGGEYGSWSNNHPVVKAINGMYVPDDCWRNPDQELFQGAYGHICGKTSNVELNDWSNGWTIILKKDAPYSIYGFYPGMTLSEAKKNDSQRSDVSLGKTYTTYENQKYISAKPKEKLGYLDTYINLYYDEDTKVIEYVEYTYFVGN